MRESFSAKRRAWILGVGPRQLIFTLYEVEYIFLVPPKGHTIYALTNIKKEPYIHSPMKTLCHIGIIRSVRSVIT